MYVPHQNCLGKISPNDGTLDFYVRINSVIDPSMTVLDLGAGRAAWLKETDNKIKHDLHLLKGKVAKVIAADIDEIVLLNEAVDECLVMRDGIIPLDDASVDLIIADYVLEHVENVEKFKCEIDRVLKKGGHFCARTPHKWHYVSIAARLIANSSHVSFLSRVQPNRKEMDVFPTKYRMNTFRDIIKIFPDYENLSLLYRGDPSYYFGRKLIYNILEIIHRISPSILIGNLFVFLKKN